MPPAQRLPPALSGLANLQALEISDTRFHEDVDHLIGVLDGLQLGRSRPSTSKSGKWGYLAAAVALCIVAGVVLVNRVRVEAPSLRSQGSVLSSEAAKAMLASNSFYHSRWNAGGQGMSNDYVVDVRDEAIIIRDEATQLMWQKGGSGGQMAYSGAERWVAGLNAEQYAGFVDWRLPTLEEAMTLVAPEAEAGWHIDPVFERSAAPILWTSDRSSSDRRWVVYLGDGICTTEVDGFMAWARAVRGID